MTEKSEIIQQLHIAVASDRTDILRAFISTIEQNDDQHHIIGSVLNDCYCEDGTLLHVASKLGKIDIVRTLLSSGSDPGIHNTHGQTAVDLAATPNITKVFNEELLQATAHSNVGRVCQLLAAGVDVNLHDSDESQSTPLHWAASFANRDILQCLCSRGADVNAVNSKGYTPLHDAVKRGDVEVVNELLAYGADSSLTVQSGKEKGKTCKELAGSKTEILHALENPPPLINIEEEFDLGKLSLKSDIGTFVPHMNGTSANGSEPGSPELKTPSFMKTVSFDDVIQPPHPVVTEEKLSLLWPQPQSIVQQDSKPFVINQNLPVYVSGGPAENSIQIMKIMKVRKSSFTSIGLDMKINILSSLSDTRVPHLQCHVNSKLCPAQGTYKLTISQGQIRMLCSDYSSLHCAISTLYQLMSLYQDNGEIVIPALLVDDWPDLHYRGVLLDCSQGRLPNYETLQKMINNLAGLKINLLQLFCRFMKLPGATWQIAYSKSELLDLVEYCTGVGIQLVPVIEVAPQVQFDDIDDLYSTVEEFLTCFSDTQFISLGPRLSSFVIETDNGLLEVLDAVKLLPIRRDQILNICGYPLHGMDSELLMHLPPHVVISEYGIQADYDFQRFCSPLSNHGVSYIMCPGTSAWNSLAGCPEAAINNIFTAVKCGDAHGALGVVVCNWSGKGHLTHQPFAWPGFLVLAGLSWNSDCHQEYLYGNLGELLNRHIFHDTSNTVGHLIVELGRAETYLVRCSRGQKASDVQKLPDEHGSTLFQFLFNPDSVPMEHLSPEAIQKTVRHLKKCQQELLKVDMKWDKDGIIKKELSVTCDLMVFAARICKSLLLSGKNPNAGHAGYAIVNMGVSNLSATVKTDLANRLLELIEPYKEAWKTRYLHNVGLSESVGRLRGLFKILVPGGESDGLMSARNGVDNL